MTTRDGDPPDLRENLIAQDDPVAPPETERRPEDTSLVAANFVVGVEGVIPQLRLWDPGVLRSWQVDGL